MIFLCIPPRMCLIRLWSGTDAATERLDLRRFSPHKQYLLSSNLSWSVADKGDYSWRYLNSENCSERKEKTLGSRCARMFGIVDKSTLVCLPLSGHMLQQTHALHRRRLRVVPLPVPYMASPGTGATSVAWEGIKGASRALAGAPEKKGN